MWKLFNWDFSWRSSQSWWKLFNWLDNKENSKDCWLFWLEKDRNSRRNITTMLRGSEKAARQKNEIMIIIFHFIQASTTYKNTEKLGNYNILSFLCSKSTRETLSHSSWKSNKLKFNFQECRMGFSSVHWRQENMSAESRFDVRHCLLSCLVCCCCVIQIWRIFIQDFIYSLHSLLSVHYFPFELFK